MLVYVWRLSIGVVRSAVVAILNAVFCTVLSFCFCVFAAFSYIIETYSSMERTMALYSVRIVFASPPKSVPESTFNMLNRL